jgi:hypothetical protein
LNIFLALFALFPSCLGFFFAENVLYSSSSVLHKDFLETDLMRAREEGVKQASKEYSVATTHIQTFPEFRNLNLWRRKEEGRKQM